MRVGVLDLGSNSIKLQIVDAGAGQPPLPVRAFTTAIKLAERGHSNGAIGDRAVERLIVAIREAIAAAERQDVSELLCFATEAIRSAPNQEAVCRQIRSATSVDVQVLSGEEEADFGFLAARRWYGWSAGRLLHVDLGGGSLEVAFGHGEEPELAISLPLGAGLLARELLRDDPPTTAQVDALNERISTSLSEIADRLCWEGPPVLASASSKTFKQLARVCGAAPGRRGTLVERHIKRSDLRVCAERMGNMTREERAQLRGVKQSRAGQIVAGAIIAHQLMASLHLKQVQICPWSVREGILLRHLDRLDNATSKRDAAVAARTRQHRTTTRRSAANAR